jgi:hypothetical protein
MASLPGNVVGAFGNTGMNRLAIRSEPNPYDKATIFSVFPRAVRSKKATLQPGLFLIPAGTPSSPTPFIVGSSSWWKDSDPEQPPLEVPVSAVRVADSIVNDFASSKIGSDMSSAKPGLFYLPGEITVDEMKKKFKSHLEEAILKQNNWFRNLVQMGDSLWARTNGNPVAIDDVMRLAAKELGLQRDWLGVSQTYDLIKCVACGNMRNPAYPICPNCKAIIDSDKAKSLNLAFAQ